MRLRPASVHAHQLCLSPGLSRHLPAQCSVTRHIQSRGLSSDDIRQRIRFAPIQTRVDQILTKASNSVSDLGRHLNSVTGYDKIEELKADVISWEQRTRDSKINAAQAKASYEAAVANRAGQQKQLNDLLQVKSTWNSADVTRFTTLVQEDHSSEREMIRCQAAAASADSAVEAQFDGLLKSILNRYHEEQIWSDKIRKASTYGSFAVLGLNFLVFMLALLVVEPWKRRKLGETFEKRLVVLEMENQKLIKEGLASLEEHFQTQKSAFEALHPALKIPEPSLVRAGRESDEPSVEPVKVIPFHISLVSAIRQNPREVPRIVSDAFQDLPPATAASGGLVVGAFIAYLFSTLR